MYANNFAAAIIVGGKVLREFKDTVYLPFGSEYKVRLKNLNNVRAKVSIELDGECVTDGSLVVNAFETTDLERFIRNGNLTKGNRFKFIERSDKIEQYRGIKAEDGIVSIRYEFETPFLSEVTIPVTYGRPFSYRDYSTLCNQVNLNSTPRTKGIPPSPSASYGASVVQSSVKGAINDAGITVEGSLSNQTFSTTHWRGTAGVTHVMNIRLLGETEDNVPVREAMTVKTKAKCKTCGTTNKATAKFCSECGTSLILM